MTVAKYLLHSTISGSGETIVMLHGYLSSSQYFKHIRTRLEKDHRVIALDLLGFGQSPKPKVQYTYDDHLDAIHSTLDHLGVTRPYILLGHSMGALIALRYATVYPDTISQLLLMNPPLFTDTAQMIEVHKATGRRYRLMLYSRARFVYWFIFRLLPRNRSPKRKSISLSDMIAMSPRAREGSYKNILGGSTIFQDLRLAHMPILIVNGHYDRAVYKENLNGRRLPSNVELIEIESGHHPLVRDLDLAETTIRSHLLK